jgi:methylated-DNA-[protein]-cysteine S-methyltransferase
MTDTYKNNIIIDTPIGKLGVLADGNNITNLFFEDELSQITKSENNPSVILCNAAKQLTEYFDGRRRKFTLPIKPHGSDFFKRVWKTMTDKVPYGTTISYSLLASLAGSESAGRAVGMANNKNPIPIIIPCHRVIGKNGSLTGFRAGLNIKKILLDLEKSYCAKHST